MTASDRVTRVGAIRRLRKSRCFSGGTSSSRALSTADSVASGILARIHSGQNTALARILCVSGCSAINSWMDSPRRYSAAQRSHVLPDVGPNARRRSPASIEDAIVKMAVTTPWVHAANELGVGRNRFARIARAAGLRPPLRNQLAIRHDAFANCDALAYYWLGYLVADGCCSKATPGGVSFPQSGPRRDQVYKLREFLGSDHAISTGTNAAGSPVATLQFSSQPIRADLARLGVHPGKTYHDDPVADEAACQPAFWLGMLDGDGCSSLEKNGYPRVKFHGTRAIIEQCAGYFRSAVTARSSVGVARHRQSDGTPLLYVAWCSGSHGRKVIEHI